MLVPLGRALKDGDQGRMDCVGKASLEYTGPHGWLVSTVTQSLIYSTAEHWLGIPEGTDFLR
jgi:hypothetical protein